MPHHFQCIRYLVSKRNEEENILSLLHKTKTKTSIKLIHSTARYESEEQHLKRLPVSRLRTLYEYNPKHYTPSTAQNIFFNL